MDVQIPAVLTWSHRSHVAGPHSGSSLRSLRSLLIPRVVLTQRLSWEMPGLGLGVRQVQNCQHRKDLGPQVPRHESYSLQFCPPTFTMGFSPKPFKIPSSVEWSIWSLEEHSRDQE